MPFNVNFPEYKDSFCEYLDSLPKGTRVGVVKMRGTFCPVTNAHIDMFIRARQMLLGEAESLAVDKRGKLTPVQHRQFEHVIGIVSLNADHFVGRKLKRQGLEALDCKTRAQLFISSTQDLDWMIVNPDTQYGTLEFSAGDIQSRWPDLKFVTYDMNGGDDVVKYRKWNNIDYVNMITFGRAGVTEELVKGCTRDKILPDGHRFILGEELEGAVSSTQFREYIQAGDYESAGRLVPPSVLEWHERSGFKYKAQREKG